MGCDITFSYYEVYTYVYHIYRLSKILLQTLDDVLQSKTRRNQHKYMSAVLLEYVPCFQVHTTCSNVFDFYLVGSPKPLVYSQEFSDGKKLHSF